MRMLEHIIKNGETISEILAMYHLEYEELIHANLHITDFENLQTGVKIKIPLLNNEVEQILENTEGFVMDYYPEVEENIKQKFTKPESVKPREQEVPVEESMIPTEKKEIPTRTRVEAPKTVPRGRAYPGILPPKGIRPKE